MDELDLVDVIFCYSTIYQQSLKPEELMSYYLIRGTRGLTYN